MTIGIVAALLIARALFGIVARVACKNDVFISDTWTPEGTGVAAVPPPIKV
jgi:hypothetical protein